MPESAHDANVITDCYYVDGIPPLLRESSASAVMGFVLLCQWCVNPSPFRDLPISGFRLLGRGAFDSIASVLALLLRRVSKHRTAATASRRVTILSPLFVFSFRFNHNIHSILRSLSFCSLGQVLDFARVYIYRTLFCGIIGQACLVSFLSVGNI